MKTRPHTAWLLGEGKKLSSQESITWWHVLAPTPIGKKTGAELAWSLGPLSGNRSIFSFSLSISLKSFQGDRRKGKEQSAYGSEWLQKFPKYLWKSGWVGMNFAGFSAVNSFWPNFTAADDWKKIVISSSSKEKLQEKFGVSQYASPYQELLYDHRGKYALKK